ncbi:MAG: DMT family transporter [Campylobacter sp.]|nr:DMT family transporter [Campylobacter sp.]
MRAKFNQPNSTLIWELALICVALIWGSTFIPVQRATANADIFSFLFWRFLLASFFMYLASLKFKPKFDTKTIFFGIFCGLMLFFDFTCQTFALRYTLSSSVAFILGLNVIMVPFMMYAFFRKSVGIFAFLGAGVAVLGLFFLSGASNVGFNLGEQLTLISAFMYALHIVFTGVCARRCNLHGFVVMQFVCVSVCTLFAAISTPHENFANSINLIGNLTFSFKFDFIFALILTSIFATVFAFFIQTLAQEKGVSEIKTVLIFTLEPLGAGVLGYIFGEKLSPLQITGAGLILAGILLSELGGILSVKFSNKRSGEKADRSD